MTREQSSEWAEVMGDQGPWIRHVAVAWQAAATDAPDRPVPARPTSDGDGDDVTARWAPLLHLLVYGLGWTRPDLGLAKWCEKQWPIDEPILRVVERWWGRDGVVDVLAWAASNGGISCRLEPNIDPWSVVSAPSERKFPDGPKLQRRRADPDWQQVWGRGYDSMHLTGHIGSPLAYHSNCHQTVADDRGIGPVDRDAIPRMHIIRDTYAGWYADFFHYLPGIGPNGRSVRTDVFVKPVGWLGEYRQHSQTGLWFRGRSSVHMWGQ